MPNDRRLNEHNQADLLRPDKSRDSRNVRRLAALPPFPLRPVRATAAHAAPSPHSARRRSAHRPQQRIEQRFRQRGRRLVRRGFCVSGEMQPLVGGETKIAVATFRHTPVIAHGASLRRTASAPNAPPVRLLPRSPPPASSRFSIAASSIPTTSVAGRTTLFASCRSVSRRPPSPQSHIFRFLHLEL